MTHVLLRSGIRKSGDQWLVWWESKLIVPDERVRRAVPSQLHEHSDMRFADESTAQQAREALHFVVSERGGGIDPAESDTVAAAVHERLGDA